jgi:hypothetical protein
MNEPASALYDTTYQTAHRVRIIGLETALFGGGQCVPVMNDDDYL